MGGALTHQVLGTSSPTETEVNVAVRKLQAQNRKHQDIFITSEFSNEQIEIKIGDYVESRYASASEYGLTQLGYVTQLGGLGEDDTNKVTIRFPDDGELLEHIELLYSVREQQVPKEWIKLVGDQVKEYWYARQVDAIARVMVDDATELPSSPLPKKSSPLKRLQSSTGLPELTPQSRVAIMEKSPCQNP